MDGGYSHDHDNRGIGEGVKDFHIAGTDTREKSVVDAGANAAHRGALAKEHGQDPSPHGHGSHSSSSHHGQHSTPTDPAHSNAGVKAGLGAGHASQPGASQYASGQQPSGHHTGAAAAGGAAAAAGGLGAGAAGLDLGARDHSSKFEGAVGDSVTGQPHFLPGSTTTTGPVGAGAGVGPGAGAGAAGANVGQEKKQGGLMAGVNKPELSGPENELKKELKEHKQRECPLPLESCDMFHI